MISASLQEQPIEGFDRSIFGNFDRFDTFSPAERARILSPDDIDSDAPWITGHFGFRTTARILPHAQHMTVLREGRTRILSHWLFWRGLNAGELEGVGDWGAVVRKSHGTLGSFLQDPELACQVDNLCCRMLLWPHRSIDPGEFIDPDDDQAVREAALAAIDDFSYCDIIENPHFDEDLQQWLGTDRMRESINVTTKPPRERKTTMSRELNASVCDRLHHLSRLDNEIWLHVAAKRLGRTPALNLLQSSWDRALVSYTEMMCS